MDSLLTAPSTSPDLLVLAGEHSGDQHAAELVRRVRGCDPELSIAAVGGPRLAEAGAELLHDLTAVSVVGFVEVLRHYSYFKRLMDELVTFIREHRPRAICFVDYPGFNLRLARRLYEERLSAKAGGTTRLLYYIGPQLWAWKGERRFAMARHLDALGVIFPFEPRVYSDTDLPVTFVGHPYVRDGFELPFSYDAQAPLLLLPGSRQQAVQRILPAMLDAFSRFHERETSVRAHIVYPDEGVRGVIEASLARARLPANTIELVPAGQPVTASAVVTSSGTASLACALAGLPGVIIYRTHPITYLIARNIVRVPFIGMANLILNKPVYPEYLQDAARPDRIARELARITRDDVRRARARKDAERLREALRVSAGQEAEAWLLDGMERLPVDQADLS